MFKGFGRKKLKDSRMFLDTYPEQKQNFSERFLTELEILLEKAGVAEIGNDERYFPSKLTEFHSKVSESEFGNVYKQIASHSYKLKLKYGNSSEVAATNLLSGLMLSMMMTKPKNGQDQLDTMLNGPDGEIYQLYMNLSTELFSTVNGKS